MSNFVLDSSGLKYTYFDASWREEHDGIRIDTLDLSVQESSAKKPYGHMMSLTLSLYGLGP